MDDSAVPLDRLKDYLKAHPLQEFKPIPYYSRTGDMLSVWWEGGGPDDFGYADPINDQLTVMRSAKDNRPIGVKVYGLRALVGP